MPRRANSKQQVMAVRAPKGNDPSSDAIDKTNIRQAAKIFERWRGGAAE